MAALQEGTYIITSALSGNPVLDLEGGNNPIANIISFHNHGGKNQQWKVIRLRKDEYALQSVYGGTYITAPDDGSVAQVDTSKYEPITNKSTRWKIVAAKGGYAIQSILFPGKAIDIEGSNTKDLTRVLLYPYNGTTNQTWNFKPVA
ncbi:hypothetical protein PT974_05330 [Cladobotryum mycophilum]|uniref:Ricin B lectin domain-containing protein n=1 Tax=Cladobotryum mycophilum TaxID=491253 RepID=A0ABR0SIU0_9HYPO